MKPHLLKIPLREGHSFNIRYDIVPHFYDQWHFHPEIELVYILKGSGRQFIGNHMRYYQPGDLVLLGSNLPHLWKSDEQIVNARHKARVEAIVLHFMPGCLGDAFFDLPEHKAIRRLLQRAQQALVINGRTNTRVSALMEELLTARGAARVLLLLQILHTLSTSRELETICSEAEYQTVSQGETDRLNAVYQYILDHFDRPISLPEVAAVAHLTPNAFCRFFKLRVKKTFSSFLMEVRIAHAVKLLSESGKSVAGICFESGFNNLSNFNRHFKAITGTTPLSYRKMTGVE